MPLVCCMFFETQQYEQTHLAYRMGEKINNCLKTIIKFSSTCTLPSAIITVDIFFFCGFKLVGRRYVVCVCINSYGYSHTVHEPGVLIRKIKFSLFTRQWRLGRYQKNYTLEAVLKLFFQRKCVLLSCKHTVETQLNYYVSTRKRCVNTA
ncbi:hypothetical protein XENOCAPTIV_023619 [Xenoophorus captivus]|uniref:Uncharacterized protein n=1 Tax=Xenoophorus captivus TaxID=1517983 RepID=A0ABV0RTJ4_9TELE